MKNFIRVCSSIVPLILCTANVNALTLEEAGAKQLGAVQYRVKVTGMASCSKGPKLKYQIRKSAGILEIYPNQFLTPSGPNKDVTDFIVYGMSLNFDGFKGSFIPRELFTDVRVKPLAVDKINLEEISFGNTGTVLTKFQLKFSGTEWLLTHVKGTMILHDTEKGCFISGKFTGSQKTPIDF